MKHWTFNKSIKMVALLGICTALALGGCKKKASEAGETPPAG